MRIDVCAALPALHPKSLGNDRSRLSLAVRVLQIVAAIFVFVATVALLKGEFLAILGNWKWLAAGGGGGFALLLTLSGCLLGCEEKKETILPERKLSEPDMQTKAKPIKSKPLLPNKKIEKKEQESSVLNQEKLARILDNWVKQRPNKAEEKSRIEAKKRILECFNTSSSRLDLGGLGLTSLPLDALYALKLESLFLSKNRLDKVPAEIFNPDYFPGLMVLDLSQNSLRNLPLLTVSSPLQSLNLLNNQLTEISSVLRFLPGLRYLNLSFNKIDNLNFDEFKQLKELWDLIIDASSFYGVFAHPQLKTLSLIGFSGNQIQFKADNLPEVMTIKLSGSKNLREVSFNGEFKYLKFLQLDRCQINLLHIEDAQFPWLSTLDLSKNRFSTFNQVAFLYSLCSENKVSSKASIYLEGNRFSERDVQEFVSTYNQMKSENKNVYPQIFFAAEKET